jgi:hypothetical protein
VPKSGGSELTDAELFALLWHALADMLGTAAAATLLRRAAQRASVAYPELSGVRIALSSLEYHYQVPARWTQAGSGSTEPLRQLVRELWPLLEELTGTVVVTRLEQVAQLRAHGLVPPRTPRG